MKKAVTSLALVLAGLLTIAGVAPAAQAYPEFQFEAGVSEMVVFENEVFTATSEANVSCEVWTHEWNGKTNKGKGKKFSSRFKAPRVESKTVIPVNFACEYDGSVTAGRAVMIPAETWTRSINVTVLPRESGKSAEQAQSALPNTGGPSKLILIGGLLLLVVGVLAAWAARRRGEGTQAQA